MNKLYILPTLMLTNATKYNKVGIVSKRGAMQMPC